MDKSQHKIGKPQTVSWVMTRDITVCYHNCIRCGTITPEPTSEQKLEFAQWISSQHDYMWPDRVNPGCHPVGWSYYASQHHTGWLCFDCTQKVNSLVDHNE